jgi:putative transposase
MRTAFLLAVKELALARRACRRSRIEPADRALLATLSRALPRPAWTAFSVRPETLLRWHRQLVARRWTYPQTKPGRPPVERPRRELILRLARENPHWGYQRIAGELRRVGLAASPTTVRKVLAAVGIPPAPERTRQSWPSFLRQQAASVLACNAWVTQQARNFAMQLSDHEPRFRLLIHDRDTKFSRAFDDVFRCERIDVIRTPEQAPNANANAERWVRTVRSDCLDRILILGRRHLEHVLRVYTKHYNAHRPHRALRLAPPDGANTSADGSNPPTDAIRRHDLLGGLIHEYQRAA